MNTRYDLAKTVPSNGVMIELGVAAGQSAVGFLATNPTMHYIGFDRWSDHHDQAEMLTAQSRVAMYGSAVMMRMTFDEALPLIRDGLADLVYIDGYAHTGQEGGKTLDDWWPKVKTGGIMAGHDYHPEYQPTINAVTKFAKARGLVVNIIEDVGNKYPSWYLHKNED